jgi:hypothetical protein
VRLCACAAVRLCCTSTGSQRGLGLPSAVSCAAVRLCGCAAVLHNSGLPEGMVGVLTRGECGCAAVRLCGRAARAASIDLDYKLPTDVATGYLPSFVVRNPVGLLHCEA